MSIQHNSSHNKQLYVLSIVFLVPEVGMKGSGLIFLQNRIRTIYFYVWDTLKRKLGSRLTVALKKIRKEKNTFRNNVFSFASRNLTCSEKSVC
jgi:hypothetical protein